jgi:microcystin-dependent protein
MADPFVGQIISVGFNWAPDGWFLCNGQTVPISQYEALYALLGTMYGGDGQSSFGLPNLNGRVPLGMGQGPGLSNYVQGQALGVEQVTLTAQNTPPHTHTIAFSTSAGTQTSPKGSGALAVGGSAVAALKGFYAKPPAGPTIPLRPQSITFNNTGGQPHENRQQFLTLNYIIAYNGIFPPHQP